MDLMKYCNKEMLPEDQLLIHKQLCTVPWEKIIQNTFVAQQESVVNTKPVMDFSSAEGQ